MTLHWRKRGCPPAVLLGIFHRPTGETRPLTEADVERFVAQFQGRELLDEPIRRET